MPTVNGQIGSGVLVSVGGGQALRADAAAAWLAVVAEVRARFGITLRLTDSYRPYAVQVRIFNERYDPASSGGGPFGDVRWWGGVRYVRMRGASAAVPGTSNHGWGVAVDVTGLGGFGGSAYTHLAEVAPTHGWSNASGRKINEAWHWEYTPADDTHPTSAPAQEEDMPLNDTDIVAIDAALLRMWREPEIALIIAGATATAAANQWASQATGDALRAAVLAIFREPEIALIIRDATTQTTAGGTVDYAALAKAVNDDAAKRLAT